MDIKAENKIPEIKKFFDKLKVAACCFDEKGALLACNFAWARLFDLERKSDVTKKMGKLFPKECKEILKEGIQEALIYGSTVYEVPCVTDSGRKIALEITFHRESAGVVTGHAFEISKYKNAIAETIESEQDFISRQRQIYDANPAPGHYLDETGDIIDCNEAALKLFRVKNLDEFMKVMRELQPEYQSCGNRSETIVKKYIDEALENGSARFDHVYFSADGEPVDVETTFVHIVGALHNGKRMLAAFTQDLRELHKAMQKIREEQNTNRILRDNSPYGVVIWNKEFKPESANAQALSIFGVNDVFEFGRHLKTMHSSEHPKGILSQEEFVFYLRRAFDGETVHYEGISVTSSGEELPHEVTLVPFRRDNELYVAAYLIDLREMKAAMAKAREADENANILINALPIASALLSPAPECRILECNQAAINLLALKPGEKFEFLQSEDGDVYFCDANCGKCESHGRSSCVARRCLIRNWRQTIKGYREEPEKIDSWVINQCETAAEKGRNVVTSYRTTLLGEELFLETTLVPVTIKGQQGFALHLRDLREARLREEAEEESRAKTRFLARMSHEIRTPMNAILGITEIELQKENKARTEEAFLRIRHSSHLLLSIINDILDISKVEAGKMEIVPKPYDIAETIIETAQLNMMHIGDKPIEFKLFVDEKLPRMLNGDELRIKQVMNNLLSNAFKYTKEGTVTLNVTRDVYKNRFILVFEIIDTGQGMSKTQLSTLFDIEFNRHNLQANRDIQGSGLGMTITYHLVSLMRGKIFVESILGKGSTFTVRLTQEPVGEELLGSIAMELQNIKTVKNLLKRAKRIDHEIMSAGRVLVVDDVESNLFVIQGMLMPYKIYVETVESGYEAVKKIKDGNVYDIIFMDHMMPGMDGVEAARLIREEGYDSPIVALTANTLVGQEEIFLSSGFAAFIAKPIDAKKLDECLKQFIQSKSPTYSENLINIFLRDAQKTKNELTELMNSGFPQAEPLDEEQLILYTTATHAIKNALANVGEAELSDIAYSLEQASRARDCEKIKSDTHLFLIRLEETIAKLIPPEDRDFLRKQLQIFCNACDSYNKKSARKALAALSEKSWQTPTNDILEKLSENILHSEFEAAAEIAREYVDTI
ncbi:MAG: PAS domain-containing protein [Clostridiales bacterium]|jgi:signal transduction histidine kinase/PAS domain-containing protein/DNA-binding response OmpR family regulator|nr:PAS domain-containing protein [Clostridiales bacterium]